MATFYSDQRTNALANPPVAIDPVYASKVVRLEWTYTTPASGAPAVGDYVELVKLPKGARVLGGKVICEALSSGAGTAGADIGYSGADTRYAAALNLDAAAQADFGNTIALNYGDVLADEKVLRAKVTGEAWAVSKKVYGYVEYMLAN